MKDALSSRSEKWALHQESFDALLRWLDPDPSRATTEYFRIREKIVKVFECHGSNYCEEMTDETFDRVARRIYQGEEIVTGNKAGYFYGVARNVLLESWRPASIRVVDFDSEHVEREVFVDPLAAMREEESEHEQARTLTCLHRCLDELLPESRSLVLEYFKHEGRSKIEARKALVSRLAITERALVNRIYKLKLVLHKCVGHCLNKGQTKD